jgi:nucleoid-associated protein YgaU
LWAAHVPDGIVSRDYKAGLIAGLLAAVVALGWLATRPSLSPQARMLRSSRAGTAENSPPPDEIPLGKPLEGRQVPAEPVRADREPEPQPDTAGVVAQLLTESQTTPTEESALSPASQPDLTVFEKPEKIETTRFHIVRKDETLSAISQQYYGTSTKWRRILEANKDTIKDANKISPGAKLIIPD